MGPLPGFAIGLEMEARQKKSLRFAFRRHYCIQPWTDFMELHWGWNCQIYVTPVSPQEVCVAMISSSPKLRLDEALVEFPSLSDRLRNGQHSSGERGAITVNRTLQRVFRGRTVLAGDASGGVDAITGEGIGLAFPQTELLADCLSTQNLPRYQRERRALIRRPALMAHLMLLLARHHRLRQRTLQAFHTRPRLFAGMLAMHVGAGSTTGYFANGLALGWNLLRA